METYLIFVMNAVNAVRVKFLAERKKIPEEPEKYCFWQFCRKSTHFPSVKCVRVKKLQISGMSVGWSDYDKKQRNSEADKKRWSREISNVDSVGIPDICHERRERRACKIFG